MNEGTKDQEIFITVKTDEGEILEPTLEQVQSTADLLLKLTSSEYSELVSLINHMSELEGAVEILNVARMNRDSYLEFLTSSNRAPTLQEWALLKRLTITDGLLRQIVDRLRLGHYLVLRSVPRCS